MLLVAIPVYSLLIKHLLNDTSPKHVVFTLWNEMINGCVTMMSSDTFKNYPFLFFFFRTTTDFNMLLFVYGGCVKI